MHVKIRNGPVIKICVQIDAWCATSSQTDSNTVGMHAKQITKKAGPSAGSANE
jgi:hypothetical protein